VAKAGNANANIAAMAIARSIRHLSSFVPTDSFLGYQTSGTV
jgi:hypothetical protein